MTSKVYVFVRTDLPPTQITVQSIHSAIVMASTLKLDPLKHPSIITIRIKNIEQLYKAMEDITKKDIMSFPFFEPLFNNELTSFCTRPLSEEEQFLLKKYQLIRISDYQKDNKESLC